VVKLATPSFSRKKSMGIQDWPASDRPREKLIQRGPESLSDAELLAIFLRTGVKGKSAVELARDLQEQHGSIGALLLADIDSFTSSRGLGEAKYAQLQAVLELSRRHLLETHDRGDEITSPAAIRKFLQLQLKHQEREVFYTVFLDNRHRILHSEPMFLGTISSATVHIREIVKAALSRNAAALIVAHNHPSGVAEPSAADIQITKRIREALDLVEIRLLDHFIVAENRVESFAERGLL
jgi:DNA repair protein RadC